MDRIEQILILGPSSLISYYLGGWTLFLTVLFVLNGLDILTGFLANRKKRSSQKMYAGGIKKGIMWMWVGISNLVYMLLQHLGYNVGIIIPNYVALYFIIMEIISLEENSKKLGLDMPTPLSFFIEKLKEIFNKNTGGNMK